VLPELFTASLLLTTMPVPYRHPTLGILKAVTQICHLSLVVNISAFAYLVV